MLEEHTLALNAFLELEKYILRTTTITNQHDPKFVSSIYDAIGSIYSTYEMEEKVTPLQIQSRKSSTYSKQTLLQSRIRFNHGEFIPFRNFFLE